MRDPEFQRDGCPTDRTLNTIVRWRADTPGFLEFCRQAMNLHYGTWEILEEEGCQVHKVATGGWSDNETVIGAMTRNYAKWATHWRMSRRGGYYEFEERLPKG